MPKYIPRPTSPILTTPQLLQATKGTHPCLGTNMRTVQQPRGADWPELVPADYWLVVETDLPPGPLTELQWIRLVLGAEDSTAADKSLARERLAAWDEHLPPLPLADVDNDILAHIFPDTFDRLWDARRWESIVPLPEMQVGPYRLTHKVIPAGTPMEVFGDGGYVRYDGDITLTVLYQDNLLWMSDSPSERVDMERMVERVIRPGRVLIAGLGLGLLATLSARHPGVTGVTVVELSPEVVQMVQPYLPPEVEVVRADFREWIKTAPRDTYTYALLDIWGAPLNAEQTMPDMLALWQDVQAHLGPVGGAVWAFDHLLADLLATVTACDLPSAAADVLRHEGFADLARHIDDHYDDGDYQPELPLADVAVDADDYTPLTPEWSDDAEDALWMAIEELYALPRW